jgi:hypothetical protein
VSKNNNAIYAIKLKNNREPAKWANAVFSVNIQCAKQDAGGQHHQVIAFKSGGVNAAWR